MMISLPTGTKVFNWLSTLFGGWSSISIIILSYGIFIIIFLGMFTFGGSTGVILANATVDVTTHDTYYVIAHFHYVLSLGAIIALLLGVLFYQDIIFPSNSFIHTSSSRNTRYHSLLSFYGINLTFTPLHFLGFNVQPRRIPDFPDYFNSWNILSSLGSGITLYSIILFPFY